MPHFKKDVIDYSTIDSDLCYGREYGILDEF